MKIIGHSIKKHKRRLRQLQKLLKASPPPPLREKRDLIRKEIKNTKAVWKAFWEAYWEKNKIGEVIFPTVVIESDPHIATTSVEPDHALDERFALPA
jgi:hypothetical protein